MEELTKFITSNHNDWRRWNVLKGLSYHNLSKAFVIINTKTNTQTCNSLCIMKGSFFSASKMFDDKSSVVSLGVSQKRSEGMYLSLLLLRSKWTNFSRPENACKPIQKIRLYERFNTCIDKYPASWKWLISCIYKCLCRMCNLWQRKDKYRDNYVCNTNCEQFLTLKRKFSSSLITLWLRL